jgi:hypothetical protein
LCIVTPEDLSGISASQCYESFETPLYESGASFSTVLENFYLPFALTTILDDLRHLVSSIANFVTIKGDPDPLIQQQESAAISVRALHLHDTIISLPSIPISPSSPPADLIHEILRTTTIIYATALSSHIPISSIYTPDLRQQIYSEIFKVSLSDWKRIPGLFLWILLVASPGSGKDALGRLLRTNETLAAMYIGLKDFGFAIECLKAFWVVQKWIAGAIGSDEEIVGD